MAKENYTNLHLSKHKMQSKQVSEKDREGGFTFSIAKWKTKAAFLHPTLLLMGNL